MKPEPAPPPADASVTEVMRHRLRTSAGKTLYQLRPQTVEPVFGLSKSVLGFRPFRLRGREKVALEWTLVCLGLQPQAAAPAGRRFETGAGELTSQPRSPEGNIITTGNAEVRPGSAHGRGIQMFAPRRTDDHHHRLPHPLKPSPTGC